MITELNPERVREIYRRVAEGEDQRGEFLTAFARAVVLSTEEEFEQLAAPAAVFILRFRLLDSGGGDVEVISEGN